MAITMFIGLELKKEEIKLYKSKRAVEHFSAVDNKIRQWNADLASRLLGQSLLQSKVIRRAWNARQDKFFGALKSVKVYRLSSANSVLVLGLNFESQEYGEVAKHRKLSSQTLLSYLRTFELESAIDTDRAIYPVVGTITEVGDEWSPLTQDGWAHLQGDFVDAKLLEQIVTRVAIERALAGWSIWPTGNRFTQLLQAPRALWLMRHWPVQLLTDWKQVSDQYLTLRLSLNLPAVREEVIERGKHWWTVAGAVTGLLALVLALASLYF
jgi:hypothetical protein